jgi:hypothetical protein
VGGNESVWDQKEAVLQLSKKKNILDRTWAGLKSKLLARSRPASQPGSVSSPACPSNRLSVSVCWSASLFGLLLYPAMILHHTVLASGVILVAGIRSQYQIIG